MWLAGWAVRREPGSGTAMELQAKALALEDASRERIVIVTADLIALPAALTSRVAERIRAQWKLERANLIFNASHTHNGPEVRPDKIPFFEIPPEFADKIEPYVMALEDKFVAVISRALENMQPATLTAPQTNVEFPQNRRSADGPMDRDVPVLQVRGGDNKLIAVVFGCACHNLTLPPSFTQFHGDYAGQAQACLEKTFPESKALFMAGAGADQEPFPRGTLELTEKHGEALAGAVEKRLAEPGRELFSNIRVGFELVPLAFAALPSREALEKEARSEDVPLCRKAKFLLDQNNYPMPKSYPCPIQVVWLGQELLLIALGGEPVADYAIQFKKDFSGPLVWVAGYSNDMFGYLPTRRILSEGGYEGGRALLWSALPAPFDESVEERITEAVRRLVLRAKMK